MSQRRRPWPPDDRRTGVSGGQEPVHKAHGDHLPYEVLEDLVDGMQVATHVQTHLVACATCRDALEQVRQQRVEIHRLLGDLTGEEARLPPEVERTVDLGQGQPPSLAGERDSEELPLAELRARSEAGVAALASLQPFRLEVDLAASRVSRRDRRRVTGPKGRLAGGVRLPIDQRHALDISVDGSTFELVVTLSQRSPDTSRLVRFIRGARVRLAGAEMVATAGTDPSGEVRFPLLAPGHYGLQIYRARAEGPLMSRVEIEVVGGGAERDPGGGYR